MARWRQARGPRDAPAPAPLPYNLYGVRDPREPDPVVFGVPYPLRGTCSGWPPFHGCGAGSLEPGPCWCCETPWAQAVT